MTVVSIGQAVRARLFARLTAGGDGGSPLVTAYQALGTVDATGNIVAQPTTAAWLEEFLQLGEGAQAEISRDPKRERQIGIYSIVIRSPRDNGVGPIEAIADRVTAAFRRWTSAGITFTRHVLSPPRDEGGWWRQTVQLWFYSDELTASAA
jgi:hypothetical protein